MYVYGQIQARLHVFVNGRADTRMYIEDMENRIPISVKLPPSLLKAIEAYRSAQVYKPTRTEIIEQSLLKTLADATKPKVRKRTIGKFYKCRPMPNTKKGI